MAKKYRIKLSLIELDNSSFHLITGGEINDHPVNLIIDTGASMSVFDSEYLKDLLPGPECIKEEIYSAGITADKVDAVRSVAKSFVLGNLILQNYPLILINMKKINKIYNRVTGKTIHGLIGSDFLYSMNAVIDFGKSIMILTPERIL